MGVIDQAPRPGVLARSKGARSGARPDAVREQGDFRDVALARAPARAVGTESAQRGTTRTGRSACRASASPWCSQAASPLMAITATSMEEARAVAAASGAADRRPRRVVRSDVRGDNDHRDMVPAGGREDRFGRPCIAHFDHGVRPQERACAADGPCRAVRAVVAEQDGKSLRSKDHAGLCRVTVTVQVGHSFNLPLSPPRWRAIP